MPVIFLWVVFIFLILFFLALISPVRFGASVKYVNSARFNYEFFVSYFHPVFFKLLYSSEHGEALKILGKTFKLKQKKESEASSAEVSEYNEDINKKTAGTRESESEPPPAEYEEKSDYEDKSPESQKKESAEVLEESEPEDKRAPLFNRIKKRIEKIKRSKPYRFLSDAVWRKKMKSWLRRFLNGALAVIVFDRLKIRVKVGLKDPAALGKLCGYFSAVRSALSLRNRKADMALEPLFMRESLEFEAELRGGTSLLRAASCCFIAVFTFPYIRTYKIWRRLKK
ncbi:MAG: hypothetical protein LBB56_08275 [Chitinispirillales bacterium]|jgi:hypothetical protein|nr:hypothetical protein [Chitinispirillales bacterium]